MSFCCTYKFILGMGVVVVWKTGGGWQVALARSSGKWQGQGCWVFVTNKERTEARQEQRHGKKRKEGRIMDVLCCPFVVYKKICWEVWWNSGRCGKKIKGVFVFATTKEGQSGKKRSWNHEQ